MFVFALGSRAHCEKVCIVYVYADQTKGSVAKNNNDVFSLALSGKSNIAKNQKN